MDPSRTRNAGSRVSWAIFGSVLTLAALAGGGMATAQAGRGVEAAQVSAGERSTFVSVNPTRILDTRTGLGARPGPVGAGGEISVRVTGVAGVPDGATAVVLNVTVTETTAGSFLTVYPFGTARPNASSLNWVAGQTVPNSVTVRVGGQGQVSFFNFAGLTHVLADVAGYYVDHTHDDRYYTEAEIDARGRTYFAVVSFDGLLQRGSPGITVQRVVAPGRFRVTLPVDANRCAVTVTPSSLQSIPTDNAFAVLAPEVYPTNGDPRSYDVRIVSPVASAGDPDGISFNFVNQTFHLIAVCS